MAKLMELDKLQRVDHDTIIRMEAKLDGLIIDVKKMWDGNTAALADHEMRLKSLEQKEHDSTLTINLVRIIAGVMGGAVFFFLTQLPSLLHAWGVTK